MERRSNTRPSLDGAEGGFEMDPNGGGIYFRLGEEETDVDRWLWSPTTRKPLWRRLYSALVPWADDYTTFVWTTKSNLWGDDVLLDDATYDELRVKKIRVRPRRDLVFDEAGRVVAIRKQDDTRLPGWTEEEVRLHALLIQQLRLFWQRDAEQQGPRG